LGAQDIQIDKIAHPQEHATVMNIGNLGSRQEIPAEQAFIFSQLCLGNQALLSCSHT
jgi:hypothetical protein